MAKKILEPRRRVHRVPLRTMEARQDPIPSLGLDDLLEFAPAMWALLDCALTDEPSPRTVAAARLLVADLAEITRGARAARGGCDVVVCEDEPAESERGERALSLVELIHWIDPADRVALEVLEQLRSVRSNIAFRLESLIESLDMQRAPEASA